MGTELLSAEESKELITLVEAAPGGTRHIDPQHALVLYALKLIAPIGGDKSKGYAPTRAGITLARKMSKQKDQSSQPVHTGRHPYQNTDPYWPFPIRVR